KLEQQNIILTPRMALFVESQVRLTPTYQMLERGDGYEFSVPAFNYPAIASRLIKRWKQDQSTLDFVLQADSQQELKRLADTGDAFSLQQLMNATINPSLKPHAIRLLTKSNPLSPEVKQFLIAKMALSEEATLVARQLAQQGHQTWLEELISSNRQVKARQIEQVLK
ncbi:hypothetical protein QTO04_08945, partial [Vibrio parahaemolyticus]